jgi:hypothetical protein
MSDESGNYSRALQHVETSHGVLPGETWESAAERRRSDLATAQVFATLAVTDAVRQLTRAIWQKGQP